MTLTTTLREGDQLPVFSFAVESGGTWKTSEHLTAQPDGVPLVLILHRHLA
jgi:hypothetical protein